MSPAPPCHHIKRSPEDMHADHIPFLILSGLAVGAGLYLFPTSKSLAVIFIIAGVFPTIGAFSNSERWPVPLLGELAMILGGVAALSVVSVVVATSNRLKRRSPVPFWLMAVPSLLLGVWVVTMTIGLASLP